MKTTAWLAAAVCVLAMACTPVTNATKSPASSARSSVSPTVPAITSQAAVLRTHLDLLLSEQVMIVGKETAAAANHEDAYAGYTALLTSNANDLIEIVRTAFGDTAADRFATAWTAQNTSLVDYGIGVVTHNDSKASAAMSNLTGTAMPHLAANIADSSGLAQDEMTQVLAQQASADKAVIDDVGAQKFPAFYTDLQTAYFGSERLGDALAERIAQKFSDRFPGDPTVPEVDRRVSLNLLLQEHAFLATLATDAVAGSRDADRSAAINALNTNAAGISRTLSFPGFVGVWSPRLTGLIAYAQKGDAASKQALVATGPQAASALAIAPGPVNDELNALIKVIDDQRTKAASSIAGDDRAAATSMQPVADVIILGPTI